MISSLADVPQATQNWLHTSVQSFFKTCNWENQARSTTSEVARLEQSVIPESFTELSFDLKVRQFFTAVNWDGTAITQAAPPIESLTESLAEPRDGFTLTDFSDLF
jgi:hypothetical protein